MAHLGTQGISWALSGIDTALWDIVGRVAGQPLHRLWGGAWRDRSRVLRRPRARRARARWPRTRWPWVERGFRTLYLKVGFAPRHRRGARARGARRGRRRPAHPHRRQRRLVARARAAHAAAARGARHRVRRAAAPGRRSRPSWRACARARRCRSWRTSRASRSRARSPSIRHGAADALQLDPALRRRHRGRAHRGRQVAEVAGLPVVTHTFGETGVGTALMLQLHAAHRNFVLDNQTYYPNLDRRRHPRRPAAVRRPVPRRCRPGPGLGVELDASASRTGPRTTRARSRAGRRTALGDRYYDRDYLIRPRV